MKTTLVIGASENTERYSNKAVKNLRAHGHNVVAIGLREGMIGDTPIIKGLPDIENVDTVTLYVNPANQAIYEDYILHLKPRRIIFNPGTENNLLMQKAANAGIETLSACTLVMLATGNY